MSQSIESASSSETSHDHMFDTEHELNNSSGDRKRWGHQFRSWRIPMPPRKESIGLNKIKIFAVLVSAACIAQTLYIAFLRRDLVRVRGGLVRVPNDPYDNTFWTAKWHSPSVWEKERQDFLHDALPVRVHSHNDYWQTIPLHEALASGCISIEADVHLEDGDLYIGHYTVDGKDQTLREMYLEPLQRMLDSQNGDIKDGQWKGIFNQAPQQTIVLLVDLRTAGEPTLAELYLQLQDLRERDYLTYWNGTDRIMRPLTIVSTGETPFQSILAFNNTHRDIFMDAPLAQLLSVNDNFTVSPPTYFYNMSNSYYASTRFVNAKLHSTWQNETEWELSTPIEKELASSQLEQARERGLISRYYGTPSHPPNLQEIVWRVLVDLKVGVLNMDNMGAVRARAHGWGKL